MNWNELTGLLALITSAGALWVAIKKSSHESDSLDAGTVEQYERVVKSAAERAERTDVRIAQMQTRYDELLAAYNVAAAEIKSFRDEIAEVKQENGDLRKWADLLVKQVVELGGSPAPMPRSYIHRKIGDEHEKSD